MELVERLTRFFPANPQEEADRAGILRWLGSGDAVYTRAAPAHLTASAWIVSPDRSRVLMAYHNLYDSWAWLGGHADGETDLLAVAIREAQEESGLTDLRPVSEDIFSVELLPVAGHEKRGEYVSSHLHLNVTFLLEAAPAAPLRCKIDENSRVAWFSPEDALAASSEPWMRDRVYAKLIEKTRRLADRASSSTEK